MVPFGSFFAFYTKITFLEDPFFRFLEHSNFLLQQTWSDAWDMHRTSTSMYSETACTLCHACCHMTVPLRLLMEQAQLACQQSSDACISLWRPQKVRLCSNYTDSDGIRALQTTGSLPLQSSMRVFSPRNLQQTYCSGHCALAQSSTLLFWPVV